LDPGLEEFHKTKNNSDNLSFTNTNTMLCIDTFKKQACTLNNTIQ